MLERGEREGQQLDNYRLVRLLGAGGFGQVYLGEHIYRKTRVAIKILPQLAQDDLQGFLTEARTFRLKHPNIVQVLDFGVEKRTPFVVMEYAPNGTLRQRHPKGTRVPLPTIVLYVRQVASALQYAHDERLVHRDVKPENMLIGTHNEILLSDFGIATIAHGTDSQKADVMAGTVPYMAPEQIQAHPRPASDQYSLAVVVYEWLCGDRPFHGTYIEMALKHATVNPPPLREKVPTIPPDVEHIVMTALAKEPKRRFGSVQAFATALEQASQSRQIDPATSQAVLIPSDHQRLQPTVVDASQSQAQLSTFAAYPSSSPSRPVMPAPPLISSKTAWSSRAKANWRTLLLIGLTLLVIASGVGLSSVIHTTQVATANANATATTIASNATGTAAIRIAAVTATSQARAYAMATTSTIAANATATASVIAANPDPYGTGGTLALYDPLRDNTLGYDWDSNSACSFQGEAYHAIQLDPASGTNACIAHSTDYGNFAYEVQMTIISGDAGGIIFRGENTTFSNYYFAVTHNGFYALLLCQNGKCKALVPITGSSAIHQGQSKTNIIAVGAQGSTITLYVNGQLITSVTDSTFSHGQIGVAAVPFGTNAHPTTVAYSNAKVWTF